MPVEPWTRIAAGASPRASGTASPCAVCSGYPDRRSKWHAWRGAAPMAFGAGVFGQNVLFDPANGIAIAKLSSQAPPLDERLNSLTMRGVEAVRRHLAGG